MVKITINKNEQLKSSNQQTKTKKRSVLKIIICLFTSIIIIATMLLLIIVNTSFNENVSDGVINWEPEHNNDWKYYFEHNCPKNKIYNLKQYESKLGNINLISTIYNKHATFTLDDLLTNIDLVLQNNDLPNNFFAHLPINPAISITIDNNDALLNDFKINVPKYNKINQFNCVIEVNALGPSYNLNYDPNSIDNNILNFKINVSNEIKPEPFDISSLEKAITIPEQNIQMTDPTKGSRNEIINGVKETITTNFKKVINDEKYQLWRKVNDNDFNINYSKISDDDYSNYHDVTVMIETKAKNDLLTGNLTLTFKVKGSYTKKSLELFATALQSKDVINESISVPDITNVKKEKINKKISEVISSTIIKTGQDYWHQTFTNADFTITCDTESGDYSNIKDINVTIKGKNNLQGDIKLVIHFCVKNTVKSLVLFEKVLNSTEIINPTSFAVDDDTNVNNNEINNKITTIISNVIVTYGKNKWHQTFTNTDFSIITDAPAVDNYRLRKPINVTIKGKNNLQGDINIKISVQCHNKMPNQETFSNDNYNVDSLKEITLQPDLYDDGIYYPITFKEKNSPSLAHILFNKALNDMDHYQAINKIELDLKVAVVIDNEQYEINYDYHIDPNIIKKIDEVKMFTKCQAGEEYKHLDELAFVIKYNGDQELKISKKIDTNIKYSILKFTNISADTKITALR